jgi:hypothetical protein
MEYNHVKKPWRNPRIKNHVVTHGKTVEEAHVKNIPVEKNHDKSLRKKTSIKNQRSCIICATVMVASIVR